MTSPTLKRPFSEPCGFRRSLAVIVAVALCLGAVPFLAGCGTTNSSTPPPPGGHSVNLSWNTSSSAGVAYNVYRSNVSGGPYAKVNSTPISGTSYSDTGVQSTHTYYYVVTAVDGNGVESDYSNQASAVIP